MKDKIIGFSLYTYSDCLWIERERETIIPHLSSFSTISRQKVVRIYQFNTLARVERITRLIAAWLKRQIPEEHGVFPTSTEQLRDAGFGDGPVM